ncbi:LVIVD repeat-containing protein [Candidatus Lokiarchaeum ossiferum]|uniref:LVIVD repeat-containing protein n=1 Tax=Candidatus Lokiarchaeum ossiferum TaxID=2951803 RepID=UPI00352D1C12
MKYKTKFLICIGIILLMGGIFPGNFTKASGTRLTMKEIGLIETNGMVTDVVVKNNISYIADDINGFLMYNVSDPENPTQLFRDSGAKKANGIFIKDDLAFIAILFGGLRIYNITDPMAPTYLSSYHDAGAIIDVYVEDELAYLSDHGTVSGSSAGIKIVNVSDPYHPNKIVHFQSGGKPSNLFVQNQTVFSADYEFGFEIIDASLPSNLNTLSKMNRSPGYFGVFVEKEYAYFTDNTLEKGLHIYNINNHSKPIHVSHYSLEGDPCDLQVKNGIAYIADMEKGVYLVNISDPTNPTQLGHFSDGGEPFDVEICGNLIYVADLKDGVRIIEIFGLDGNKTIQGYNFIPIALFPVMVLIFKYTKKKKHLSHPN